MFHTAGAFLPVLHVVNPKLTARYASVPRPKFAADRAVHLGLTMRRRCATRAPKSHPKNRTIPVIKNKLPLKNDKLPPSYAIVPGGVDPLRRPQDSWICSYETSWGRRRAPCECLALRRRDLKISSFFCRAPQWKAASGGAGQGSPTSHSHSAQSRLGRRRHQGRRTCDGSPYLGRSNEGHS